MLKLELRNYVLRWPSPEISLMTMQKQQMQLFSLPDRKGRKQTVLHSFYFSFSTYSNRNVNTSFKMTKCRCEITIKTTTATNRKLKGKVFKTEIDIVPCRKGFLWLTLIIAFTRETKISQWLEIILLQIRGGIFVRWFSNYCGLKHFELSE